jgi:hypothetical protein
MSPSTPAASQSLLFADLGPRKVVVDFSGGTLSSDGGLLLLRQLDASLGLTRTLASCFSDQRDQRFVDHSVPELLRQRVFGLALGYEDLNDHEHLRRDPLLAAACDKADPLGQDRCNPQDRGIPLAGPSTLNRLELSNNKDTRCHKLPHDPIKIENCLLGMGVRGVRKHAKEVVIDLDSMGHLLHGLQEGRYYNDYYTGYCYLPLYIVVGDIVLWAQLRTSDKGGADGVVPALEKVVAAVRRRCKKARIIVRGDSGFCVEEIMAWCETQSGVYYCLGLARNSRLIEKLGPAQVRARERYCLGGAPSVREFAEFEYQTLESWSRPRRVVGKAEVTAGDDNPRFIVTSLPAKAFKGDPDRKRFTAAQLYEEFYCARGEMENVLKQQVLDLEADKLSTHFLASNQLRLWLASFAYLLIERLRAVGCHGTALARATAGSIRLKLLKVAARVTVSVRRVYIQLSSAYPRPDLFRLCHARLMQLVAADG